MEEEQSRPGRLHREEFLSDQWGVLQEGHFQVTVFLSCPLWPFSMPLPVLPPLGLPHLTRASSALTRAGLYSWWRILSRRMT